jgi:adenine-specific DNA glycosylase
MSYLSAVIVCQEHQPTCATCPMAHLCKGESMEATFERMNEMSEVATRWLSQRVTKRVDEL